MTPQSPKAVTAEKYMQKIFTLLQLPMTYDSRNGIPKGAYESVTEQIKLAQEEGYRQGIKNATDPSRNDPKGMKSELSYLLKENYAKGFSDGQVARWDEFNKQMALGCKMAYENGQVAMREDCIKIIRNKIREQNEYGLADGNCAIVDIRALRPHAPGEGTEK